MQFLSNTVRSPANNKKSTGARRKAPQTSVAAPSPATERAVSTAATSSSAAPYYHPLKGMGIFGRKKAAEAEDAGRRSTVVAKATTVSRHAANPV